MANEQLNKVASPALPLAPTGYERPYQDELNNIQRLFYNRISNVVNQVIGPQGGQYIDCPNGLFFDLGTYSPAAINTGYPLQFGISYLAHGISVVSSTQITASIGGVYNFQYSSAVTSTNASVKNVFVWIVRNGTPIGYSTNIYTISGSGHSTIISWQFNIDLDVGDYVELYWGADDLNVSISTTPATPPHPGVPANVLAVNFIAPLPNPRPTPP